MNALQNAISDNDIAFEVAGPAKYNGLKMAFEVKPVVQFKTIEGWERNKRTGAAFQ